MQISDLLGQYNRALSAGAEKVTGTKGVEKLVSSLNSLTKGHIFEGTVSSMKNGQVTLSLSNGSKVSARIDGKVSLSEGQSMFFQVKSNDGATIAIRPFVVDGNGVNYTLMQALSAAGLPADSNYLSMVDKMMEEQMPIDRASLQQMARLVNANGNIDVRTLVQMSKLGIELTPENAAQFENYLGDKQAITAAIDSLIDELPMAMQGSGLSDAGLRQMNAQMLSVITEGLTPEPEGMSALPGQEPAAVSPMPGEPLPQTETGAMPESAAAAETVVLEGVEPGADNQLMQAAAATADGVDLAAEQALGETGQEAGATGQAEEAVRAETGAAGQAPGEAEEAVRAEPGAAARASLGAADETAADGKETAFIPEDGRESAAAVKGQKPQQNVEAPGAAFRAETAAWKEPDIPAPHTLAAVLTPERLEVLNDMLKELVGQETVHYDGNRSVSGLLQDLRQLLDSSLPIDRDRLQQLLSSGEFKTLVKDTLEQQWTLRPEELTGSGKINKLYEKLETHMNRIGDVLKATGQENANFTQTAADIRSNVDFMNQINQAYTYVQIPLKMSGQTASGELYVYTNKRALADGDKELTAFLHLDMDNLGPTDISVKLLNREVSTNFYLENDAAYDLVAEHLPILEAKLKEKGYNCKVSVIHEGKHVNFVEDFLKKDQPSAGQVHRYSFDMRA
ncbi:MAG: flagellar hook-length control protein FliK [Muribaculaceae bacterium]|nr:flagellar hook-length control protein FliK [Roseburia sp.]MCM1431264.1 flagellar hook-length control protein FliK [Muribaculaceae bacterium]MCM1492250.1 flagellar hook-length control protein FliK [Muribaculaceae bacterium]